MNKKIIYVINHIDWFWSHRLPLAKGAQDQNYNVHVAVTGAENDSNLTTENFTGHELPASNPLKIICALHKTLKIERPDIIHAITLKYAFFTGLVTLLHPKIKTIHTIAGLGYLFSGEGIKPQLLRLFIMPLLRLAFKNKRTQLIFQNPDDQILFLKRGLARKEQCHLIRGSGVDTNEFFHQEEPQTDIPLIVMPTRLIHNKGIATFIKATKILNKKNIEARFQIAGGLSQSNPLAISKAEMHDMLKDSTVEWLGKVSDMPALYRQSNLIVYPSYYGEGIPKVLLEAASTGRAIITTDHPGCREAVTENENGLLVPIKNPTATANAIEKLLNNPALRKTMGEKSRYRAESEFTAPKIVEQTLAVYD